MSSLLLAGTSLVALGQDSPFEVSGGVTAVALYASDERIEADQTLSADMFIQRAAGNGGWFLYIEANSSIDRQGASIRLVETNADAATAVDENGGGRVQLSEVNYHFSLGNRGRLTLGLIDPSGYLDRTRITNDENVQFLGVPFVNNPTIEVPDYTLGMAYESLDVGSGPQVIGVLASSNGLADNPGSSYSELARIGQDDKGMFAALGLAWPSARRLTRVGAWLNTRSHPSLSGDATDEENYGLYAVHGRSWGSHAINVRLGLANDEVSRGSAFTSFAYRYRWRQHVIGAAAARTYLASAATRPGLGDTAHLEVFGRFTMNNRIHFTASVQSLRHSGFVAEPADPRHSATVTGFRFHYEFR